MIDDLLNSLPPPPLPVPQEPGLTAPLPQAAPEAPYPLIATSQGIQPSSIIPRLDLTAPPRPAKRNTIADLVKAGPSGQALQALTGNRGIAQIVSDPDDRTISNYALHPWGYQPNNPVSSTTATKSALPQSVYAPQLRNVEQEQAALSVSQGEAKERQRQSDALADLMSPSIPGMPKGQLQFTAGVLQALPVKTAESYLLPDGVTNTINNLAQSTAGRVGGFVGNTGAAIASSFVPGGLPAYMAAQSGDEALAQLHDIHQKEKSGALTSDQARQARSELFNNTLGGLASIGIATAVAGPFGRTLAGETTGLTRSLLSGLGRAGAAETGQLGASVVTGQAPDLTSGEALGNAAMFAVGGIHEGLSAKQMEFARTMAPHAEMAASAAGMPGAESFIVGQWAHETNYTVPDNPLGYAIDYAKELQQPKYDNVRTAVNNDYSYGKIATELKRSGWTDDKKFAQRVGKTAVQVEPHVNQALQDATQTGNVEQNSVQQHQGTEQGSAPPENAAEVRPEESAPDRRSNSGVPEGQVNVQSETDRGPNGESPASQPGGVLEGVRSDEENRQHDTEGPGARGANLNGDRGDESLWEETPPGIDEGPPEERPAGEPPAIQDRVSQAPRFEVGDQVTVQNPNPEGFVTEPASGGVTDRFTVNGAHYYNLAGYGEIPFTEDHLVSPERPNVPEEATKPQTDREYLERYQPSNAREAALQFLAGVNKRRGGRFDADDVRGALGSNLRIGQDVPLTSIKKGGVSLERFITDDIPEILNRGPFNANEEDAARRAVHGVLTEVQSPKHAAELYARPYRDAESHPLAITDGDVHFDHSRDILAVNNRAELRDAIVKVAPHIPEDQIDEVLTRVLDPMAKSAGVSTDEFVKHQIQSVTGVEPGNRSLAQSFLADRVKWEQAKPKEPYVRSTLRPLYDEMRSRFPGALPANILRIVDEAHRRVRDVRSANTDASDPAIAIIRADIRHKLTNYDDLLRGGMSKSEARAAVEGQIVRKLNEWSRPPRILRSGEQAAVSFLESGQRILHLLPTSDVSSLVHEFAHIGRRSGILDDADTRTVERFSGVRKSQSGVPKWTTAAEEKFARAFERYFYDGVIPPGNTRLATAFAKIKDWMRTLYEGDRFKNISKDVSPEVRAVFDRLIGGKDVEKSTEPAVGDRVRAFGGEEGTIRREMAPAKNGARRVEIEKDDGSRRIVQGVSLTKVEDVPKGRTPDVLFQREEPSPERIEKLGMTGAAIEAEAKRMKLTPASDDILAPRTRPVIEQEVAKIYNERPEYGKQLVTSVLEDINKKGRSRVLDDTDIGVLFRESGHRYNELRSSREAVESLPPESPGAADAHTRLKLAEESFDNVRQAMGTADKRGARSASGRSLQIWNSKVDLNEFHIERMRSDMRRLYGRELSPEEDKRLVELEARHKELQTQLDEQRTRTADLESKLKIKDDYSALLKEAANQAATAKKNGMRYLEYRNSQAKSGPAMLVAKLIAERKAKEAPEPNVLYQSAEVPDDIRATLLSAYPHLSDSEIADFWQHGNEIHEADEKLWASKGRPIKTKNVEESAASIIPSDIQQSDVRQLALSLIRSGVHGEDALLTGVHDALKHINPDLTRSDAADLLTGYGKSRVPSKDAAKAELSELVSLTRMARQLEDYANDEAAKKTGIVRHADTDAVRDRRREVADKQREFESRLLKLGIQLPDGDNVLKSRLAKAKAQIRARTEETQRRIAQKDFAPVPRELVQLDREGLLLKQKQDQVIQEYKRLKNDAEMNGRTPWEKFVENLIYWKRAEVITGPKALARIPAFDAWYHTIFMPMYLGAAKVTGRLGEAANLPTLDKWLSSFKTIKDEGPKAMLQALKEEPLAYNLGKEYPKGRNAFQRIVGAAGRLHAAEKAPFAIAEQRMFEAQAIENARAKGLDPNDELVRGPILEDAAEQARQSILTQENILSKGWSGLLQLAENRLGPIGKIAGGLLRIKQPIVRVPTNLAIMSLESSPLGLAEAITRLGYHMVKTGDYRLEDIPQDVARRTLRAVALGVPGTAAFAYGATNYKQFGGLYVPGQKNGNLDPGDVKVAPGFGWLISHTPIGMAAQMGATFELARQHAIQQGHRDLVDSDILPAMTASLALVSELPMFDVAKTMNDAVHGHFKSNDEVRDFIVPQIVQQTAKWFDTKHSKVQKRKARNTLEAIESGIPKLRETLPRQ